MEQDTDSGSGWDDRTIGRRLRMIRNGRGKSLRVVAGLAGISASHLSRIENGKVALDRRSEIVALANALRVVPSELIRLPFPAPADGDTDAAVGAVRRTLLAVSMGEPGGRVLDVDLLRKRVITLRAARRACRDDVAGQALPELIQDLHTTIASGREGAALAELAVSLHVSVTAQWLRVAGASPDLRWHPVALAEHAAQRLDQPLLFGEIAFGRAQVLLSTGNFDLAWRHVQSVTPQVGTDTDEGKRVAGMLTLTSGLLAATLGHDADVDAAFEEAAELAEHTGEDEGHRSRWGSSFGPSNVRIWRAAVALEAGDHDLAAAVSEQLHPEVIPSSSRRAAFLVDYGRALAPRRHRYDDAVGALRKAELLSPLRVHRNPLALETLATLLAKSKRDAVGRELRAMAYRAGLPV